MPALRRSRLLNAHALAAILLSCAAVTHCSRGTDGNAPDASAQKTAAAGGPAIAKAGVNRPEGDSFTCWITGSGFQNGDRVLVNGTTEIPTTFGNAGLVTFRGGVELLKARTALTLAVTRPGTGLRSNSIDAQIPSASPKG